MVPDCQAPADDHHLSTSLAANGPEEEEEAAGTEEKIGDNNEGVVDYVVER